MDVLAREVGMAIEEPQVRLRRKLEEAFGAEEASFLMDRPPGGWSDLVTNQTLDLKLDALRAEIHRDMAELSASVDRRLRTQTLVMTTTLIAGIGLTATLNHL
jgi:hypothetical protein